MCVKGVSCIDQLSFVQPVTNVPIVGQNLPVGCGLHQVWRTWASLGPSPKVVIILKDGYTLLFWIRPQCQGH